MSDALPLPPRPNLQQYKKLARDFQHACKSGDGAIREWAKRWAETLVRLNAEEATPDINLRIRADIERLERQWLRLKASNDHVAACTLAGAQFFIARCHGFTSWPKFLKHLDSLSHAGSPVSRFEAAADAIVNGDLPVLQTLIRENPELARARSTREHRSTLLHYVSANGIEDFRQKTPPNIVAIAKLLLEAGSDVNAESDAYGGRSTTLGLTATSWPPQEAGLQLPLMEMLIEHGARIDGPDSGSAVVGCLHNGRGEAAEFFASRGARLDLEGAAGVGRLDVVKSFVNDDGTPKPPATMKQLVDGFAWACEFGKTAVVDFLLQRAIKVDAKLPHNGQTGLHWAALGGHADTVKMLLDRSAPVNAKDESFNGTPLEWCIYGWGNSSDTAKRASYYEIVATLVTAGARLDEQWFEKDDYERQHAVRKLRSDPYMQAALRGELPKK